MSASIDPALLDRPFAIDGPEAFNALAMEPLGRIAGTGSSFVGFSTTAIGTVVAWFVAGLYNDTVIPLVVGYLGLSTAALIVVLVTERGQLFHAHHEHEAG